MEPIKDEILKGLKNLERFLQGLPTPVGEGLRVRVTELRELLVEQRPPRLVLVGRRGAGKSTLINAIFDEPLAGVGHVGRGTLTPRWYSYVSDRGRMEVLDTRGIGEALNAGEPDGRDAALRAIVSECTENTPDAILFLVKAKEIESRTDEDVEDLATISGALTKHQGGKLPVIGVVNQCDELSPPTVRLHAAQGGERQEAKLEAVRVVEHKLFERIRRHPALSSQLVSVIGVVSYAEWGPSRELIEDLRWRIDDLVRYVFERLPAQAQVEMARLSRVKKLQRELGMRIVHATAATAAAVAAVPLPVADIAPITTAQVGMVTAIGYIGGRDLSPKAAAEFLVALGVNVGAGYVFREVARGLIKWAFPTGGSFVSAAVAYAATLALGTAAIAYFVEGKTVEEARDEYGRTKSRGEREYEGGSS
ncbi:MAG TPA: GTPase [Polyangiaceae bacterium]